jgi:DNA helicase-4
MLKPKGLSIEVNWLGRLISNLTSVQLAQDALLLQNNINSEKIELCSVRSLTMMTKRPWGHAIHLVLEERDISIHFLKPKDLTTFVPELNERIKRLYTSKIESVERLFSKNCTLSYLRDSNIPRLEDAITTVVETYQNSKSQWETVLTKHHKMQINELIAYHPFLPKVDSLRDKYEKSVLVERKQFYDAIESNPLTEEQRLAVIRSNDRNLVLAAAGTGKTSVMVAKALDLIDTLQAKPNEILLLAYNSSAAKELKVRIKARSQDAMLPLAAEPKITTFHALGLSILRQVNVPCNVSKYAEDEKLLNMWVTKWTEDYISKNPEALTEFITLLYHPSNPFDFKSQDEYEKYICDNEYRTLQGEKVRGYQEVLIANFLFLNNVSYEYEPQYIKKSRIEIGFDYKPDFYFTGTKVYLEHFGISRNGKTRADIDENKYNEDIGSKRELHLEHGTTLLETYHYNWVEGNLESRLASLLSSQGIELVPKKDGEILETLKNMGEISRAAQRFLKALQAIRVERLDDEKVESRLTEANAPFPKLNTKFLSNLHVSYKTELNRRGEIDFDDMIIRAISVIQSGEYKHNWKYILVDEFQDISAARWELIEALIAIGNNPILTVVGDDWQSIYRFNGGKLNLITEFESRIGKCTTTTLQKTFRYNSSIAETAGQFIMENPAQYTKLISTNEVAEAPQVYLLDSNTSTDETTTQLSKRCAEVIETIRKNDSNGTIAIIARYNYLLRDARAAINTALNDNIYYWTFHSSKGLEADYCILLGFFRGKYGFPNENKDDAVVEALLPALDKYAHSEERRLMYVGLTRAKKKSYLIADPYAPSEFIDELLTPKYKIHIASKSFEQTVREIYKCPNCTHGHLRMMKGDYGDFYVCTSGAACKIRPRVCEKCKSPLIDTTTKSSCRNPRCGHEFKICTKCGRPMKLRSGKYGQFYGCSGYGIPDDKCSHTEKLQ